jgi:uncharacterized DUF497 family protein
MNVEPPWRDDDFRLIIGTTQIDYDLTKEAENRKKHGYSLESAVYFFSRLLLPVPQPPLVTWDASTEKERRHEHMTVDDDGKVVFLVTTMREDETVRVISCRSASSKERELFEADTGYREPRP